jgi:hypothetical protein
MALDEQTRHALHQRFDEVLGPDHAAAAMTAYPPAGDELATRRDLHELELRLEATLHREIGTATRSMVFAIVGAMIANASLTIGVLGLTR